MKIFKIVLVIVIILGLSFVGYKGYLAYQKWQETRKSQDQILIESLKANQGMIVKLTTELAEIQKKVIGETLKETIAIKEEAPTYEAKKEELIELRKDPVVNEEKIKVARIVFEDRIDEFQASPDKILINLGEGEEKIVIYENKDGNLVSLESGITITRHRALSEVIPILAEEELATKKTSLKLKAGGYYSFDNSYGVIISKGIFTVKDYSLNASILLSDYKDFKFTVGGDIGYRIKDNLELGVGYSTDKNYYLKLQYSF